MTPHNGLRVSAGHLWYENRPILLLGTGMEALEGGNAGIPGAGDLGPPHRSLHEWERYIRLMADSGLNWLRLYCAGPRPWACPLRPEGWSQQLFGGPLDFWQALSQIVDTAKAAGVMVEYCLFDRCDPQLRWGDHPFNRANGGPLDRWQDFFDVAHRESIAIQQRYLVEVIQRLGGAPNLFFDLCNELTPDTPTTRTWASTMAAFLRNDLGWQGPLGISTPCHARADDLCLLPGFDLCLPHGGELHSPETYWEPERLRTRVLDARARYAPRPILVDEIAHRTTRRNFREVDFRRERAAFWAAITGGGTTVRSCWQPFGPTPTLAATAALRRLLEALPWWEMVPGDDLLQAPVGHAWLLAHAPKGQPPAPPLIAYLPHAGVRRLVLALPSAPYRLAWHRGSDGAMLGEATHPGGSAPISVPPTRADLLLVVTPA